MFVCLSTAYAFRLLFSDYSDANQYDVSLNLIIFGISFITTFLVCKEDFILFLQKKAKKYDNEEDEIDEKRVNDMSYLI